MNKILAPIALIVLFACNKKENIEVLSLLSQETLKIPIPESFNPDLTRIQYYESDSGEYLAILNKTDFSIGLFEIEKKQLILKIPLAKEGPNGVGLDNGFQIVSQDCLFLATIPPQIKILDFNGKVKYKIAINDNENKVNFLSSNNEIPFLFGHKKLFGIQPFLNNFLKISENEALSINPIYQVDFSKPTADVSWLQVKRPSGIWDEGKKDVNLSWADKYDSIIVAPYTDHRLWVISKKEGKLIGYKEAKTTSVTKFQIIKESYIGDKGIIENLESDRYEIILYDQYRDVFYRFFYIGIDLEQFKNISPRTLFSNNPKVGVLVLDNNLDILGEHIFEDHHIETWNYFVGKKGLYVSTNNPNRDDYDENFLRYDIIRFEGLEYED